MGKYKVNVEVELFINTDDRAEAMTLATDIVDSFGLGFVAIRDVCRVNECEVQTDDL